jgi:pyruvate ferredoxin oxidoreductase gamma subunit
MKNNTIEVRWHGRGGQGAVTSAELLALAAINEGKYAQAMPSFGPERRGAPVLAFNRVNNTNPIHMRVGVLRPDIVVVLDPGLLEIIDITAGLKENGTMIINSSKNINEIKSQFSGNWKLAVVDATTIAKEIVGVPIVNTTMLGSLVKATEIVKLESLEEPLMERFGGRAKNNIEAAKRSYQDTKITQTVVIPNLPKKIFKIEKLPSVKEVLVGAVVNTPGIAKEYKTGDWRSASAIIDLKKCNKCGLCFLYCPEGCIRPIKEGYYEADLYYCKGCGICAKECPKNAINMIEV